MKRHALKSVALGGACWDGGAQTLIHKGTNGRWRDEFTDADCRFYEETARRELGEECAGWLASAQRSVK
jgi:aryl sulfotransferase